MAQEAVTLGVFVVGVLSGIAIGWPLGILYERVTDDLIRWVLGRKAGL